MRKYILANRSNLIVAIIFRFIFSLLWVFTSIVIQKLVDTAINGNKDLFIKVSMFSITYFVILSVVYYLNEYTKSVYLRKTLSFFKKDIFYSIIHEDYEIFNSKNSSEYISNLTNDLKLVEDNYLSLIIDIFEEIFTFIFTIIVLIYINIYVTIVLCLVGTIMLLVPYIWGKYIQKSQNDVSNSLTNFTNKVKDILGGYEIIKAYNIELNYINKFNIVNGNLEDKKFKNRVLTGKANATSLFLSVACQFSGVIVAGFFVINKTLSAGVLVAILQLGNGVFGPIKKITQDITSIKSMNGIIKKLLSLINVFETDKTNNINRFNENIKIKNLTFSYDNKKNAINNISYNFIKNKKYIILGESGCGKTTFIKTMLGYYKNFFGDILLDNISLKQYNNNISKISAVIHQNIYMFNESIRDNICLNKKFSDDEIDEALSISGIKDFIYSLPKGLDTLIHENGSNLSGGQKQRISIARAIIQKMPILFLDESTSALDSKTAYEIENLLLNMKDLTIVTITHNLNEKLLKQYDEIIVMKSGNIIESGEFEELIKREGYFYELYKTTKNDNIH
ncbi:ABC transporter ATP-binding protein [Clostridium sp. C8]|uniref:ABC transporter ATP-binding protein n=1 Tax=Clostridium sp. C8 TaxID=1667357 RepID=UPI00062E8B3C|nr:ABC transporter ATP-binding protein [Clostridium sp. C8]KLE16317.1 hypothetical protein AAT22_06915 [Clostridium sp. C8]